MAPEDVHKTAFVTPDGQVRVHEDAGCIVNSGATLVRQLRKVLEEMPRVGGFIDDIVVDIDSQEDHLRKLNCLVG